MRLFYSISRSYYQIFSFFSVFTFKSFIVSFFNLYFFYLLHPSLLSLRADMRIIVCVGEEYLSIYTVGHTVGGDKLILDPRRSWGPVLECRRIGRPPPPPVLGVPPGELAQDGAIRIFGVIRVLSDSRLLVNVLATRRKLLSLADGELNHPPNIAKQTSRYARLESSPTNARRSG